MKQHLAFSNTLCSEATREKVVVTVEAAMYTFKSDDSNRVVEIMTFLIQ